MNPDKLREAAEEFALKEFTFFERATWNDSTTEARHTLYRIPQQKLIAFENGAHFGYQQGRDEMLGEVLALLRENYVNGGKGMADFIEQRLGGGKKN